jgi:hypothetical protein
MFLSGVLRQCKSLSEYQRYFSRKNPTQRWGAQCVKPISQGEEGADVWAPFISAKSLVAQILAIPKIHQCSELTAVVQMKSARLISS